MVLVVSLLATPFTVRLLGSDGYGLLALVTALIAYVGVVDLGMGVAATRFASEAFAGGDERREAAAVWTAAAITLVPSALVTIVIWLTAPVIVEGVLDLGPNLEASAVLSLRLGSLALVGRVLGAVLNTPELVRLRWDLYVLITNGTGIAQVVAVPLVVAAGGGVGSAVGVMAASAGVAAVLHVLVGVRLAPAMRRFSVQRAMARPLIRFGGGLVVANVLGVVLGNAERFILASTDPIRSVGHYSLAASLSAVIAVVPIAICQPLMPAFARLDAGADVDQSAQLYRRALTSILAGVLPIAVVLSVIGRPFLDLWAGSEFGDASIGPLRVLLLGVVVNACAFVPYNFLIGTGATKVIVRCHLYELALYPLYAVPIILRFGAIGAAAVWTLRLVLVTGFLVRAAARKGGASTAPFGKVMTDLGPAIGVLALPVVADAVVDGSIIPGAVLMATLPVYAWLAWRRALDDADRTQILRLLRIGGR